MLSTRPNLQILIEGPGDYLASGSSSRCEQMVARATSLMQTRLMFVPTLFWVDEGYKQLKTVNSQASIQSCDQAFLPVEEECLQCKHMLVAPASSSPA